MLSIHKLSLSPDPLNISRCFSGQLSILSLILKVFSINCESTSYSSSWLVARPYRECEIHLLPEKNLQKATVHAKTIRKMFAWIRSLLEICKTWRVLVFFVAFDESKFTSPSSWSRHSSRMIWETVQCSIRQHRKSRSWHRSLSTRFCVKVVVYLMELNIHSCYF